MSLMVQETAQLLELLPENELRTINDLVKMLVRSWDPDFTKATNEEKNRMDIADNEMKNGIYFSDEEVWEGEYRDEK